MSVRKFRRIAMKGVMGTGQSLRHLFVNGPHEAKYPDHAIVKRMVEKGWVRREGNTLSLTDYGAQYVRLTYPTLTEYKEVSDEYPELVEEG